MVLIQYLVLATLASMVSSVVIKVENLPERCHYDTCPEWDKNQLNVHLVAHTHDDVGWLKTVDQYYYGLRNEIQKAGVQYIIDTVIEELIRNKERKFIYVETAYFWKYWQEQNEDQRSIIKELVRTGQLELINGGWSMPDEAATHYNSLIDQSTWGLRRLNDIFGKCGQPKTTWQIDPFGHSKELASLYAQMGYDSMFFAREDHQDVQIRAKNHTLEHVWLASDDLGQAADLFTGMMRSGYGPIGFNWDASSLNDAIVDNPESEEYNVPDIVQKFVEISKLFAKDYQSNHIMFPMGTDFQYLDSVTWFKNLDKLIKHVNEAGLGVRAFYSTPSCYAKALHDSDLTWSTKSDDYFPYSSSPNDYWTGYYTSRPALKRMERMGNNLLQACKQLDVFAGNDGRFEKNVTRLREMMGVMQHHDAVTGTEKQHVANNYAKNLHQAMVECENVIDQSYRRLVDAKPQQFCPYLNISSCPATEGFKPMSIYVYNPLAHDLVNHTIRLPIRNDKFYSVHDNYGKLIPAVLVPIPEYVQKIPGRQSKSTKEIVFQVTMKPLSLNHYSLDISEKPTKDTAKDVKMIVIQEPFTLMAKNDLIVAFDSNGRVIEMQKHDQKIQFNNSFQFYTSERSGAYIFDPLENRSFSLLNATKGDHLESTLYIDEEYGLVQEVHQQFKGTFVDQIIKVLPNQEYVEFEWVVGPINVDNDVGKEIVTRYETDLDHQQTFQTDANGRQLLQRKWNYRPTWRYEVEEPISGNYYPVNSRIIITDKKRDLQMIVMTDRSQGGSISPDRTGGIDLMVHRRLLNDDHFGVGEPLNESGVDGKGLVIRGRHLVLLERPDSAAKVHRPLAQQMFMQPMISFAENPSKNKALADSPLNNPLPDNVHLLTLERWHSDSYLLRLEHFYQRNEDPVLSEAATVSLKNMFKKVEITSAKELTLAANQDVRVLKDRLVFKHKSPRQESPLSDTNLDENLNVKLEPMQIRTFMIQMKYI